MKAGWRTERLGDVCQIIGGGTPSKANTSFYSGDIPWATVRDMRADLLSETEFKITKEAVKKSSTNIIPKDNVIIATRVGLGKVCLAQQDTAINQDLRGVVPNDYKKLSVKYLYSWFKSVSHKVVEEGTGATVQGVKLPFIKSLQIPIPPIDEQQRIVAILDQAFEGIAKARANEEQNLQSARALFESHLQSVFTQRGEGWLEKTLIEVCEIKPPKNEAKKILKNSDFVSFAPMEDLGINQKYLNPKKQRTLEDVAGSYTYFAEGDVLLAKITPCFENGKLGIAKNLTNGIGFGSSEYIVFRPNKELSNEFLYYFLSRKRFIEKGAVRMSGAVGHKRVSKEFIEGYKIAFPLLEVQKELVKKIDALSKETQRLEPLYQRKIALLDELKKSLLQQAFAGEL